MARQREKVSRPVRRTLAREAGGKCANPGCINYRTHIHHIREWAIYKTNDQEHMIAICPTCHDAIHKGPLEITDETIYRWKNIKRSRTRRDYLYVEPSELGKDAKLLLGSIAITGQTGVIAFELSPTNRLGFRLLDEDIFLTNLSISTLSAREILRVVDNHITHSAEDPVRYDRRPGKIRVTAPLNSDLLQPWALNLARQHQPSFASDGNLCVLDAEVIEPSIVRVQGVWPHPKHPIIITREYLMFLPGPHMREPISIKGEGVGSVLIYGGPINTPLFGFAPEESTGFGP